MVSIEKKGDEMFKVGQKVWSRKSGLLVVKGHYVTNFDASDGRIYMTSGFIPADNAEKFPKTYERLCTMPGVTEDERAKCIEGFLSLPKWVCIKNTEDIRDMFMWRTSKNGSLFWNNICKKVRVAEQKEPMTEAAKAGECVLFSSTKREPKLELKDVFSFEVHQRVKIPWLIDDVAVNDFGLHVRGPFVRAEAVEVVEQWPTTKDLEECCGVWTYRGGTIIIDGPSSIKDMPSRKYFDEHFRGEVKIEPAPIMEQQKRDEETARAVERYPRLTEWD